jgi:hypothetical protein
MRGRTGKAEQDGQAEWDRQNRTVKTGLTNQAGEQDRQSRIGRQDRQNRTGQAEQDRQAE